MAYSQDVKEQAVRLAEAGIADRDIAEHVGVPINTVINWRVKAGIKRTGTEPTVSIDSLGLPRALGTTRYIVTDDYGRRLT